MTLALARWLLRRRKRWLERRIVGVADFEYRYSRELDRVVAALDALR
jgi:hypothetical protein